MLGAELGESFLHQSLDVYFLALALKALCISSGNDLGENTESYLLACLNAAVGKIVAEHELGTNGIVTEHLNLSLELGLNDNLIYKAVLNSDSKLAGDLCACLCNDLARKRINDRLDAIGKPDILLAKSVIDGIMCVVMASTLGIGCAASSVFVLLYQGALTLVGLFISDLLPASSITYMSVTGSLIIVLIGTNMLGATKVKTANMTPAIFLPALVAPLILWLIG